MRDLLDKFRNFKLKHWAAYMTFALAVPLLSIPFGVLAFYLTGEINTYTATVISIPTMYMASIFI